MRATSRQANLVKQLSSVLKLGRCFSCDQVPEATSVQVRQIAPKATSSGSMGQGALYRSELITCGGSREDVSPGKVGRTEDEAVRQFHQRTS
ncbi:hypothetical protein PGT21_034296 [Puccinia graminis f. sp. tritici]|uniref:Uncharacterized protein n=1 Tax=Puccinia graminis f. sp. tritici TaxID=56615 RepID=A0A5B0M7B4_PUCGR|nr:hypothetical protein PGT21_034296 [Puccinia graminis f. sp. tritici]KAA1120313.1 hypothetical protein PGTUg99_012167 [Puccinia graminis f. sp. tritici]